MVSRSLRKIRVVLCVELVVGAILQDTRTLALDEAQTGLPGRPTQCVIEEIWVKCDYCITRGNPALESGERGKVVRLPDLLVFQRKDSKRCRQLLNDSLGQSGCACYRGQDTLGAAIDLAIRSKRAVCYRFRDVHMGTTDV